MKTFIQKHFSTSVAATLVAATSFGCFGGAEPELGDSIEEVIGGVPVRSPRLNAIGSLVSIRNGQPSPFCTATLVTPTVLVTAKHCVINPDLDLATDRFAIGFDGRAPERLVPLRGAVIEDTITGGGLDLGADVAVIHLAEAVNEVVPMPFGAFDPNTLGERYSIVGYGTQDNDDNFGTRFAGSMTLRATTGRIFEIAFGSFEEFVRQAPRIQDLPSDPAELREIFDSDVLLDDYEVQFGGATGDAQMCFGDSGGPLLQKRGGRPTLVGVNSSVFAGTELICDVSSFEAVTGPAVMELIDREIACPLVGRKGSCDGNVAVRCSNPNEGRRRILRNDCATLNLTCGIDADGVAGCIAPTE